MQLLNSAATKGASAAAAAGAAASDAASAAARAAEAVAKRTEAAVLARKERYTEVKQYLVELKDWNMAIPMCHSGSAMWQCCCV